jgi:NAD(P)-dependent dehydrogenase (short-subunit alcohol dehydrogenase family)
MNPAAPIADAVLVTGAGRRVGLHLAERMLDRQRPVIAHFHAETEGVETLRRRGALCVAADLATESGTQDLIRAVQASATSLRAVVHNASAFERTAPEVGDALRQMDRFYAVLSAAYGRNQRRCRSCPRWIDFKETATPTFEEENHRTRARSTWPLSVICSGMR